jgi:Transposase DDE domain
VIAVDWSAASPGGTFVELRAAVVWLGMGRGLTVYQRVYPAAKQGNRKAEAALLKSLAGWIPAGTRVIVVTDAGFRTPWFTAVTQRGWNWIGRVRGGNHLCRGEGLWQDALDWGRRARPNAQRLTDCQLTERKRMDCDLVLVRRKSAGRLRYRRPGHGSLPKAAAEARRSAHEPWVLVHSQALRDLRADEIVALYARRMQIEENFRDTKSLAFGMGAEIGRSRSAARLQRCC